ncbi:uncharacterized protein OCT59_023775 [Rhizophagus irregularis]|uniref:uncharacterized protein n=1 Tax=Rhizophagus irregularis TaxID=588596 RepID=UPI00331E23FB|nr:hypothetical protein OCT59_023775 [Rhizophagus irregularis]
MSNNAEFNSNSNDWNKWIEDAISKNLLNIINLNNFIILKKLVPVALERREVDFHDNVIHFYGVPTSIKENQRKEYSLVIKYAENGTLRKYLKENFQNLIWKDKINLAFQLAYAVSCLHNEGIVHRDLHSNNVLVHQNTVKIADFGLSKRIEETSNSQSKTFGLIPYTDPKSFNKNCWNIEPDNLPTINQVVDELKVLVLKTKDNIIKDFNLNDNNKDIQSSTNQQPILNVEISENIDSLHGDLSQVIQNFNLTNIDDVETSISSNNDNNKDIQSSTNQQPILNVEISENIDSLHGDLSQVIQNFNIMMNTDDIETSISSNNISENNFNMIMNDIINLSDEYDDNEIKKQKISIYLNSHDITLHEINNLSNQDDSNSIVLLGIISYLGINTNVDKKKAFELFQKAAELGNSSGIYNVGYCYMKGYGTKTDGKKAFESYQKIANLGNAFGMNNLGYCYENGIGTDIDKQKVFGIYQKAADLGNLFGINNLGLVMRMENGIGNMKNAFELYQKAADLGNSFGINNLGRCYENGIGTDIDKEKALELYRKAADLGNLLGVNNVGRCYKNGIGTDVDMKKAIESYLKAADSKYALGLLLLLLCYLILFL